MKKITTVEELMEILGNESKYFGLRKATEHDIEVMERGYLDRSVDMFDNEYAEYSEDVELLDGTSSIGINENLTSEEITSRYEYINKMYEGDVVLLICDTRMEYGTDDMEYILGHDGYGADVYAIVEM